MKCSHIARNYTNHKFYFKSTSQSSSGEGSSDPKPVARTEDEHAQAQIDQANLLEEQLNDIPPAETADEARTDFEEELRKALEENS
ncbi:MAG: hypothetical protein SFU25_08335 [Candidatus Caenarcaniphilales bacterium]|nr:hypothetical protein [Candidatus Caenarcaniphilales bacterium]